jgi:hypothetical protein
MVIGVYGGRCFVDYLHSNYGNFFMRTYLPAFCFLTCLVFSSRTYAANEQLGQWPVKPTIVKAKQFTTIFGTAPAGNYQNTPAMIKAQKEKERQSVLPQNVANIPQFGWRLAPELLRAEDIHQLKLSPYDQEAIKARLSIVDQILQDALIPSLKDQRYLVDENDHLDARFQLAQLAHNMNKQMLLARQKTWTIEQADTLYRVLQGALERNQVPNQYPLITNLICSQLLTDMADYIYKPTELRFEQYATLMNQRRFCGKFPSRKMDGSLTQAYSHDKLRELHSATKHAQTNILMVASQKLLADITGFTPQQAFQASSKKAPSPSPVTMSAAAGTNMGIKEKGLKGELPQAPFKFTFDEMDQVGYYLESIVGTGKGENLKFPESVNQLCSVLHPELRARIMNPGMATAVERNGVQRVMGNLMQCASSLKQKNIPGAGKLQTFFDQYATAMRNK